MASHLQVLGSGSADSHAPPSALLFFEHTRYLFGAGEGTQRICTEYHVRMSKVRHVFTTRLSHEYVGGLTGLLITLADLGLTRVGVHGPGSLKHFLQASRNVSVRSGMAIDCYEASLSGTATSSPAATANHFEDQNISVDVLVLAEHKVNLPPLRALAPWYNHNTVHTQAMQTDSATPANSCPVKRDAATAATAAEAPEPVDRSIDDTPVAPSAVTAAPSSAESTQIAEPAPKKAKHAHAAAACSSAPHAHCSEAPLAVAASIPDGPPKLSFASVNQPRENARQAVEWVSSVQPALVAYIVSLAATPGKFDLAKAKALGIPPGPLYAKLKAGESVTLRASEMNTLGTGAKPKRPQKQQKKKAEEAAAAPPAADEPMLTFHPADCVAAPTPGPKFAVVDCPNEAFIDNIVQHAGFAPYQQATSANAAAHASTAASSPNVTLAAPAPGAASTLAVIMHMAPLSLLLDPRYTAWMESFGPTTQHMLLHSSTSTIKPVFKSAALNYLKMQQFVNPAVFPAQLPAELGSDATTPESNSAELLAALDSFPASLRPRLMGGSTLLRFHLLSGRKELGGFDSTQVLQPIRDADLQESLVDSSNAAGVAKLHQWRDAMHQGKAAGKTVLQIAGDMKLAVAATAESETKEAVVAMDTSASAPVPPFMDFALTNPSSLADFTPAADILSQLAAQSDAISPQFLFLGTGSAIPSKYRNVTGQFFHPGYVSDAAAPGPTEHPIGGFFFDCGEGSYGQLCLRYAGTPGGPAAAQRLVHNLIADLKALWISHIHADHHLGALSILSAYKQTWMQRYHAQHPSDVDYSQMQLVSPLTFGSTEGGVSSHHVPKLLVVGPRRLYFWLKEYAACAFQIGEEDHIGGSASKMPPTLFDWIEFVTCSELMDRDHPLMPYLAANAPALAHRYPTIQPRCFTVFQTVQVRHCNDAYGLIIETAPSFSTESGVVAQPPYKLVISGDTQPCQALVDAGVDATLMIHEATLEDDMIQEARDKRHSTTRQAIEVGLKMGAQRILLTHFSQRYPKIPTYSDHFSSRTCLAFDLMCVRFNQLTWLPALTPAFAWMFDEDKLLDYEKGKAKEATE